MHRLTRRFRPLWLIALLVLLGAPVSGDAQSALILAAAWSPTSDRIAYGNSSGTLQIDVAPAISAIPTRTPTASAARGRR